MNIEARSAINDAYTILEKPSDGQKLLETIDVFEKSFASIWEPVYQIIKDQNTLIENFLKKRGQKISLQPTPNNQDITLTISADLRRKNSKMKRSFNINTTQIWTTNSQEAQEIKFLQLAHGVDILKLYFDSTHMEQGLGENLLKYRIVDPDVGQTHVTSTSAAKAMGWQQGMQDFVFINDSDRSILLASHFTRVIKQYLNHPTAQVTVTEPKTKNL